MRPATGRAAAPSRLELVVEVGCVLIVIVAVLGLVAWIVLNDGNGALFHG